MRGRLDPGPAGHGENLRRVEDHAGGPREHEAREPTSHADPSPSASDWNKFQDNTIQLMLVSTFDSISFSLSASAQLTTSSTLSYIIRTISLHEVSSNASLSM